MYRYARDCSAVSTPQIESIDPPFSNFQFIETRFPGRWLWPLRRIFSQVRLRGGRTLVFEELDPAQARDLSEENEDIQKACGTTPSSRVWRLSFFTKRFSTTRGLASATDEDLIGYLIVKRDEIPDRQPEPRVYESVILPSTRENNFIRGSQEWTVRIGKTSFRTPGYLYAQQNNISNVCAHVACRTAAARFHESRDMTYREMNTRAGIKIDHATDFANRGLSVPEMIAILEAAGASCFSMAYGEPEPDIELPPFQKHVYGSIESGYPAVVVFRTGENQCHAIPVFGHTFNEDMWVAHAERSYFRAGEQVVYIPSESWLSTFIAHDDNLGSNYCIPRRFLRTRPNCTELPDGPRPCTRESYYVTDVISTLPKKVKVDPVSAEVIAAYYLFNMLSQASDLSKPWGERVYHHAEGRSLVLRPILVESADYREHMGRVVDWNGNGIRPERMEALNYLPQEKVWMVEVSVPELFSANRRKLGEVIVRAEVRPRKKLDFRNYLTSRIPGYFVVHKRGGPERASFDFAPSGIEGHVSLYGCEG